MSFFRKKPNCPGGGDSNGGKSDPVNSLDPNDIHGYLSESGSHYMRQEIQNIHYEIEFENDTTLATAAAHTIIVRDTLDATKFDLNSLAAHSVTIGDRRLELNGEQTFARTLDMRPELYVIAQIEQEYNPTTGIIQWTIQSLDPMTMEPTNNPYQGVLPVNYNGNGIGFIDYSVNLKQAFADGTSISNRAGIIFDQEDLIMTPTWTNIVDAVKPTSHIEEVTVEADTLNFSFVSNDSRSGMWYHTLYFRNSNTEQEWKVKKAQIFENSYALTFDEAATTEYLVMAVDSAGNHEEKDMVAEYTFVYDGPGPVTQTDALVQGWNWWSTYVEQNGTNGLEMLETALGHNGLTIKSQNDFTDNYYQDIGVDYWYGSLENLQNEQGYLINVSANCNTSMTGTATIPANHPITILPNWNWVGYPVASAQTVTTALAGFSPSPDDVVKGQSDFTSYYEGFGWYPDDFALVPGQSYLYCSNATANKTLTYANGSRGWKAPNSGKTTKLSWKTNVHAYADNFNVIAVVNVDNVEQRNENLELGAFVNGECRGNSHLRYFAPIDRYVAMLTVTGQEDEQVEFRLIDTEIPETEKTSVNRLGFKKNAIVGRLGNPYEIRFGECDVVTTNMALYPNPVEKGHEFSLDIPHDETLFEIVITDALGVQVRHETGALNAKSVKGLPTAGVYVIKAVAKSGTTYHGRIIVE
ncbi:MAG: T9SS type A sorting domain-containing protein [Bacteroidales bacterium]|nr:T9SS type A sorting domain-containing protein [Bacteroidales bacterium]